MDAKRDNRADFKWALGLNKWGTELLGIWPTCTEEDPLAVRLRIPLMICLLLFWICLPQTWALMLVIQDLALVIDNLMSNTAAFGGSIKLYFLWRNKNVMRPVVESVLNDWLLVQSSWKRDLMLRRASSMRLVTMIDYSVTAFSAVGFMVLPLLDIDIRLTNNVTDRGDRQLLVQSYYPGFDYWRSPYFEITKCLQCLGAIFTAFTITVPENYFGAMVIHTSAQLEILGLELESYSFETNGQQPKLSLGKLVQRHAHLIACVSNLERSFSYVTLAQVFDTSIILCSYGFQFLAIIGASEERVSVLQMVSLLSIMSTMMLHTLVDCVVGETLAMQSASLTHSIYKCQWYAIGAGKRARDLIPMMMMSRTQRPLTAGKLLPLSLASYCSILKASAGYISMLVAVNTK